MGTGSSSATRAWGGGVSPSKVHWQTVCPAKTQSLQGAEPCAGCPPGCPCGDALAGCPPVMAQAGAQCTSTHPAGGLPPSPGVPGQGARGQQESGQGDGSWVLSQPGELMEGGAQTHPALVTDLRLALCVPLPSGQLGGSWSPGQSSQVPRAQHCCPRALTLPPELLQVVAFGGEKRGGQDGTRGSPALRCKFSPEHLVLGCSTMVQTGAGLEPGSLTVQRPCEWGHRQSLGSLGWKRGRCTRGGPVMEGGG